MTPRHRVRLALGAVTPQTRRAIDSAVRIAHESGSGLECLFVEEAELFRAAELPITREVGASSGRPRRFEPGDLAVGLRRQAIEARQALAQAAAAAELAWTFDVVRGALLPEALQRAAAQDVIVIGVAGLELEVPVRALERPSESATALLALVDSLPEGLAAIRAALQASPRAQVAVWHRLSEPAERAAGRDEAALLRALERDLGRPLRPIPRPSDLEEVLAQVRAPLLAVQRQTLLALAPQLVRALRRRGGTVVAGPVDAER